MAHKLVATFSHSWKKKRELGEAQEQLKQSGILWWLPVSTVLTVTVFCGAPQKTVGRVLEQQ